LNIRVQPFKDQSLSRGITYWFARHMAQSAQGVPRYRSLDQFGMVGHDPDKLVVTQVSSSHMFSVGLLVRSHCARNFTNMLGYQRRTRFLFMFLDATVLWLMFSPDWRRSKHLKVALAS
jgi:hypothetical protein